MGSWGAELRQCWQSRLNSAAHIVQVLHYSSYRHRTGLSGQLRTVNYLLRRACSTLSALDSQRTASKLRLSRLQANPQPASKQQRSQLQCSKTLQHNQQEMKQHHLVIAEQHRSCRRPKPGP